MAWNRDRLSPVETLLFRSDLVKVGYFRCPVSHWCFPVTEPLDNDMFVFARNPVWIRRGTSDFQFVEPGGILIHRAGSAIERRGVGEFADRTYWFAVRPDVFADSLRRRGLPTREMGEALFANPKLRYRLAVLVNQLTNGQTEKLATEEEVLTLFHDVCEQRADRMRRLPDTRLTTAARRRRLTNNVRAFLDSHMVDNIGLDAVAHAVGTSLYHLCRTFKGQTGLTLHAYRTRQRLGLVVDRLVDGTGDSLTELALASGFHSHSHLSRVFHRQMGTTPSSLRSTINAACVSAD